MLGRQHRVRSRSASPTRAKRSASFARSRDTERGSPLYIASLDPNRPKKKQGNYMITPCNFSICDTIAWVLDTRIFEIVSQSQSSAY